MRTVIKLSLQLVLQFSWSVMEHINTDCEVGLSAASSSSNNSNNNARLEMTDSALTGPASLQNTGNISSAVLISCLTASFLSSHYNTPNFHSLCWD